MASLPGGTIGEALRGPEAPGVRLGKRCLAAAAAVGLLLAPGGPAAGRPGGADPRWDLSPEAARQLVGRAEPGADLVPASWPGGKKVAVALTFDLDAELVWIEDPGSASPSRLSRGRFGPRAGLARVLDLLDRRGLAATFFFPALIAELYPRQVAAIQERGRHEIGFHGYAHERVSTLSEGEEREAMARGLRILRRAGIEPRVYRSPSWEFSPSTLSLLREFGFRYDSSLMGDDRPYEIVAGGEPTGIVEFPVDWSLDDWPYFQLDWAVPWQGLAIPSQVLEVWREEFEGVRADGGVFVLTMHPQVIGRWSRLRMLHRLLDHIDAAGDAWYATLSQIGGALKPPPAAGPSPP